MKRLLDLSPTLVTLVAAGLMLLHGPIAQLPRYHDFADRSVLLGIPHAADVLSNLGFAVVALAGGFALWPQRGRAALVRGWPGWLLFLAGLGLTAAGSAWYHWAPDNGRLVWDRLPIALACAGLLAAVRAECRTGADSRADAVWLALLAVASVAWWHFTERAGMGDLRPYLLLQGLPLILGPLWLALGGAPRRDRIAFGAALGLYVLAKAAELLDHPLLELLGVVSGHTLKHLLATAAAALIVVRLAQRSNEPGGAAVRPGCLRGVAP